MTIKTGKRFNFSVKIRKKIYRNALITTPRVNHAHDFDLKYLYD